MTTGIIQLESIIKDAAVFSAKTHASRDETELDRRFAAFGNLSPEDHNESTAVDDYEIQSINYEKLEKTTVQTVDTSLQVAANYGIPKEEIIYTRIFENPTSRDQVEKFTVHSTVSTIDVKLASGISFGPDFTAGILFPIQDNDAKNLFGPNLLITGKSLQHEESKSGWSATDEITIADHKKVTATVAISSKEYTTNFQIVTSLKGPVGVVVENQQTGKFIATTVDLYEAVMRHDVVRASGGVLRADKRNKSIIVVTSGSIHFRIGLNKTVKLQEETASVPQQPVKRSRRPDYHLH